MGPISNHIIIPDTQVTPGVLIEHLSWIGHYICDEFAHKAVQTKVIHLGDHWDMHSLSSYDKGTTRAEGSRYEADVAAGNEGFALINDPIQAEIKRRKGKWTPELHLLRGNHEDRITRAAESTPELYGKLSHADLLSPGWTTHDFLVPVPIDGVIYAHYFVNNASGRPITGMMPTRLKTIGASFTAGHQQGLQVGMYEAINGRRRGIIAGSCYLHNESYRGPQACGEWRGILACFQVENGDYDLMEVSLDYLCRRYEGCTLKHFLASNEA